MRHACSASTRQRCRGYSSGPKIESLTVLSVPLLPVRHVDGAIVDNLNFIEVKIRVTAEVFFDDLVKVFFIDFDLALYEALVLEYFTG
jgi:hypothetical protein